MRCERRCADFGVKSYSGKTGFPTACLPYACMAKREGDDFAEGDAGLIGMVQDDDEDCQSGFRCQC